MSENKIQFSRQPRFLPDMPEGKIRIPNPPPQLSKPEISWFMILMPPLVMLVVTLLLAMTSKSSYMLLSIVMTLVTLMTSLYSVAQQISKYNAHKKMRNEKYLQALADIRSELSLAKVQQIEALSESNPNPEVCLQRMLRIDSKLWERTASFEDFLSLRVGIGNAPFAMTVEHTQKEIIVESDALADEPERLAIEFKEVENVPVCVDLLNTQICGLAGEERKLMELLRVMLLQIVTHHGYDDVKIILLIKEEHIEKWQWISHLPHIWRSDQKLRYIICGSAMARQTLESLYSEIKGRVLKKGSSSARETNLPHYVFIVEDVQILENESISEYLYNPHENIGVSSIFLATTRANLPANCNSVVTLKNKMGEYYNRVNGMKSTFTMDVLNEEILEKAVRHIAPLRIKSPSSNFTLPEKIELMEMVGVKNVEEVNVLEKWMSNRTYKGMPIPIGVLAGSETFNLDLHETGHGPHGLVAGTTGSGKSELLQSLIVTTAMHYHPHDVVFILIDYKGGGMADAFKGLPHLVGTITNLGGNQTSRALVSIKSELKRRQRLFSEAGVNSIDKYQKQYYQNDSKKTLEPIPHLIMIADEFAELKQEQPEFMKELVSAARVGRSLGVHLILATQKPAGVVDDQIWSNSKFKICLKVQDEADSRDVIKRTDAAMIKEPGRAFIQVGNDEVFEMFQSAWSGADYTVEDKKQAIKTEVKRVYKIGLNGRQTQIFPVGEEKFEELDHNTQLNEMVQYIIKQSKKATIEPLKGPWLPPMQEIIYLDDLCALKRPSFDFEKNEWSDERFTKGVGIGNVDHPAEQHQDVLQIDYLQNGNLFIYGASGSGKTTLIETITMALACNYSPDEVNVYIMDFAGTSLKKYEQLPHCGGVMFLEQEEKINQFMIWVNQLIDERKKAFDCEHVANFKAFKGQSAKTLPAVFIMVDNYFALSETYEEIADKMLVIAREGARFGIYVTATATNATMVRYKFAVNFNSAIALHLSDKGEYYNVIGKTEGLEPEAIPGRGLVKNKPPMEIQIALPYFKNRSHSALIEIFKESAKKSNVFARQIPELPERVQVKNLQHLGQQSMAVIGLNDQTLEPIMIDLKDIPYILVAGEAQTGKSTFLVAWLEQLRQNLENRVKFIISDSRELGIYPVTKWEQSVELSEINFESLKDEISNRRMQLFEARRNGVKVDDVTSDWQQLVFVFDDFNEFAETGEFMLKEFIEGLIKKDRDIKVAIIAAGEINRIENNWEPVVKSLRDTQTGIIFGSMKQQNIFNARMPYGCYERELRCGDGYFILKGKYAGMRAICTNLE